MTQIMICSISSESSPANAAPRSAVRVSTNRVVRQRSQSQRGMMTVAPTGGQSACITPVLGGWCHSLTCWRKTVPNLVRFLHAANNRQPLRLNTDTRIRAAGRALPHGIAQDVGDVAARDGFGVMPAPMTCRQMIFTVNE